MKNGRKSNGVHLFIFFILIMIFVAFIIFRAVTPNHSQDKPKQDKENWVGAWAASPQAPAKNGTSHEGFENQTVRFIVHPHIGGKKLRIRLSNVFGSGSLSIDKVHVALAKKAPNIDPETDHSVTFGSNQKVTIPPGAKATSDPVSLQTGSGDDLAISVYVHGHSGPATWHKLSMQDSYISDSGNHVSDVDGSAFKKKKNAWYWLNGVDVQAGPSVKGAVVVLGSSIANGNHSTINANHRWPDELAKRFIGETDKHRMSVLNEGLSANQLLNSSPGKGQKALARLNRDVFNQTGVKALILHLGLNDIRHYPDKYDADKIIAGMKKVISRTHDRGLKIYGGTLTPFKNSDLYTSKGEKTRQAVNHWIRTAEAFDGVIDFDKAVRDPGNPERYLPEYDAGDHFHPNDIGYKAMAEAVDLSMFK